MANTPQPLVGQPRFTEPEFVRYEGEYIAGQTYPPFTSVTWAARTRGDTTTSAFRTAIDRVILDDMLADPKSHPKGDNVWRDIPDTLNNSVLFGEKRLSQRDREIVHISVLVAVNTGPGSRYHLMVKKMDGTVIDYGNSEAYFQFFLQECKFTQLDGRVFYKWV